MRHASLFIVLAVLVVPAPAGAVERSALDYPDVQSALDACSDGDRLHLPARRVDGAPAPYRAPRGGWIVRTSVEIYGDGMGLAGDHSGTSVTPFSLSDPVFVLKPPLRHLYMHDLKIRNDRTPQRRHPGNHGVTCTTEPGEKATNITVERVLLSNLGDDAFHFEAANASDAAIIFLRIKDCEASNNGGSGLYVRNAVSTIVDGGYFAGNMNFGAYVETSGGTDFRSVAFEGNNKAPVDEASTDFDVQLRLKSSHAFTIDGCHFETFDEDPRLGVRKTAVTVEECYGGRISASTFGNDTTVPGSRGIFIVSGSKAIHVGPNHWSHVEKLVEIRPDDRNTNCVIMPQAVQHYDPAHPPRVVIPDEDRAGNFAFMPTFPTSNVGAGVLLPRTTTAMRDSMEGRSGLVVYNSDEGRLNVHDGRAWQSLGGASGLIAPRDMTQVRGNAAGAMTSGDYPRVTSYVPLGKATSEAWSSTVGPGASGPLNVRAIVHAPGGEPAGDAVLRVYWSIVGGASGDFAAAVPVTSRPFIVPLGQIPREGVSGDDVLQLTIERVAADARDTFAGTLGLSGILVGPPAD